MFSDLPSPPAPTKAMVACKRDTTAHIKFILCRAIDEMTNPIDFGETRKIKMADDSHFVKICWKT